MSAKDHPLQTSGLKTDGLEGQGARHRYPCDAARPRQRRFCLSIRIAPYRTHSRSTMHEASPAASFIHVRPSRPRLNRATLLQCSAASNSRSRSICALRLAGTSGSGFSDARSLSPISRTILCMWSMSIRLRMTAPSFRQHAVHSPLQPTGALLAILNRTGDRRFWLYLRERLYGEQRVARCDLWLSATCAVLLPASDGLSFSKAWRTLFVP